MGMGRCKPVGMDVASRGGDPVNKSLMACNAILMRFDQILQPVSFPKIISGGIDGAARKRFGWRQWVCIVGPLDPTARPCPTPSACAPDCNTPHTKQELAGGAAHRRSAFRGPSKTARRG